MNIKGHFVTAAIDISRWKPMRWKSEMKCELFCWANPELNRSNTTPKTKTKGKICRL